ncbi:hypothetical protein BDR07DRAFT_953451 [Suillus spraguei]|nr:hypothetical protein BDR07DRAFT_953451 [Suillus spraguei]
MTVFLAWRSRGKSNMATIQNLISSTEMHQHSQVSRPRPQQRPGRLKRLRFPMARAARAAPPAAPTTPPPTAAAATTFKAQIRHLFARSPRRAHCPFHSQRVKSAMLPQMRIVAKTQTSYLMMDILILRNRTPIHNNNNNQDRCKWTLENMEAAGGVAARGISEYTWIF